jgi:hypothetical protein
MASTGSRRAGPAQAPGKLSQSQLEMGLASMEQASEEWSSTHGEHEASSRREQAPARHSKVQRKRKSREALTQRPGDTTMAWRGSARAATTSSSQRKTPTTCRRNNKLTKSKHHRGRGLATRERARDRHGRSPEFQRRRGCRRRGRNRADLADRQNRCRLIYRLSGISAAETDGARQNRARRRRGDAVTRRVARE